MARSSPFQGEGRGSEPRRDAKQSMSHSSRGQGNWTFYPGTAVRIRYGTPKFYGEYAPRMEQDSVQESLLQIKTDWFDSNIPRQVLGCFQQTFIHQTCNLKRKKSILFYSCPGS